MINLMQNIIIVAVTIIIITLFLAYKKSNKEVKTAEVHKSNKIDTYA